MTNEIAIDKSKYVVRKVCEQGEDAVVSKKRFDALLNKMLDASPQTNVGVVARRTKNEGVNLRKSKRSKDDQFSGEQ